MVVLLAIDVVKNISSPSEVRAVVHCSAWTSSLRVASSGADMDPSTDKAYILKFNKAFGGLVDFLGSFNGFPRCRPSLEVALKSNHSAYIFGVLDYFHFAKLLTVCRHPLQQLMTDVIAILYPTALASAVCQANRSATSTSSVCLREREPSRAANRASMDETKAPLPCECEWALDVFLSHECRVSSLNTQPRAQDTQSPQQRNTTPAVSRKNTRVNSTEEGTGVTKA